MGKKERKQTMTYPEIIKALRTCFDDANCDECLYFKIDGCMRRLSHDAADALEVAPHWIEPDANHLPPLEEEVLVVWEASGQYGIAALTEYQDKTGETYKVWEDDMSDFHSIYSVQKWMPIPKIPKADEEEIKKEVKKSLERENVTGQIVHILYDEEERKSE